MSNINAIQSIALATAQRVHREAEALFVGEVTTTDATPTTLIPITPDDSSAGVVTVMCSGFDGVDAVTGIKAVRFIKLSGTVTLGTIGDLLAVQADGSLSTATFSIVASGGDIIVQVTGVASYEIGWKAEYKIVNVTKVAAL